MLIIPGQPGKDVCDRHLGVTRRDLLRVGGSSMLGLSLGSMFQLQAAAAKEHRGGGLGWGKAKSIILMFLQGGPSHLDLWDPKENVPDNVRSPFANISTKLPGVQFTELLPKLAQVNDKFTLIRSMSYTPKGLFNHTAAIYQMLTGYTTDRVSPSGQLEVEAGTRVVEVVWPKVANSDNHSWDVHKGLTKRMKQQAAPLLDAGLSALVEDMDQRGLLDETLLVAVGEFGRSPERGVSTSGNDNSSDGRDHWPYCYTAFIAGAGIRRGFIHGKSDKTGSGPLENPVHPRDLLATIYHAFAIDPSSIMYNHVDQPRELVKGTPLTQLFG